MTWESVQAMSRNTIHWMSVLWNETLSRLPMPSFENELPHMLPVQKAWNCPKLVENEP